jgi:mono/diheme cytochrome c family protein
MTRLQFGAASALALLALAGAAQAQPGPAARDARLGRELALQVCSACHLVAPDQAGHPILEPPAPTFAALAARPGVSAAALHRFIRTTHWDERTLPMNMPNAMLTPEQQDEVVAYILSLRPRP